MPSLRDEPAARVAVQTAIGLMQSGARALVAGAPGELAGDLQIAGGEWIPLINDTVNPLAAATQCDDAGEADLCGADRCRPRAWRRCGLERALSLCASAGLAGNHHARRAPASGGLRSFFSGALIRGDRIVATSSFAATRAIERFNIPPERIAVVPRSVDTRLFDPASIDVRRPAAFRSAARIHLNRADHPGAGPITAANGQDVLVEAAAILAGRGLRGCVYVLAGDDRSNRSFTRALMARIKKLGLESIFRMTAPFHDMPAALAAAHLVVRPALELPVTGRTVAEAQAMARPVITTQVGILPEHVLAPPRMPDELRTGWLVRPGHPMELADAIGVAMGLNDTAYQALAARARQFAQFMFSPESVVSATRAVYTALLARDR